MRDAVSNKERWKGRRAPTQDPSTNHHLCYPRTDAYSLVAGMVDKSLMAGVLDKNYKSQLMCSVHFFIAQANRPPLFSTQSVLEYPPEHQRIP